MALSDTAAAAAAMPTTTGSGARRCGSSRSSASAPIRMLLLLLLGMLSALAPQVAAQHINSTCPIAIRTGQSLSSVLSLSLSVAVPNGGGKNVQIEIQLVWANTSELVDSEIIKFQSGAGTSPKATTMPLPAVTFNRTMLALFSVDNSGMGGTFEYLPPENCSFAVTPPRAISHICPTDLRSNPALSIQLPRPTINEPFWLNDGETFELKVTVNTFPSGPYGYTWNTAWPNGDPSAAAGLPFTWPRAGAVGQTMRFTFARATNTLATMGDIALPPTCTFTLLPQYPTVRYSAGNGPPCPAEMNGGDSFVSRLNTTVAPVTAPVSIVYTLSAAEDPLFTLPDGVHTFAVGSTVSSSSLFTAPYVSEVLHFTFTHSANASGNYEAGNYLPPPNCTTRIVPIYKVLVTECPVSVQSGRMALWFTSLSLPLRTSNLTLVARYTWADNGLPAAEEARLVFLPVPPPQPNVTYDIVQPTTILFPAPEVGGEVARTVLVTYVVLQDSPEARSYVWPANCSFVAQPKYRVWLQECPGSVVATVGTTLVPALEVNVTTSMLLLAKMSMPGLGETAIPSLSVLFLPQEDGSVVMSPDSFFIAPPLVMTQTTMNVSFTLSGDEASSYIPPPPCIFNVTVPPIPPYTKPNSVAVDLCPAFVMGGSTVTIQATLSNPAAVLGELELGFVVNMTGLAMPAPLHWDASNAAEESLQSFSFAVPVLPYPDVLNLTYFTSGNESALFSEPKSCLITVQVSPRLYGAYGSAAPGSPVPGVRDGITSDPTAAHVAFADPSDVALSADGGLLFIADSDNGLLRLHDRLAGLVTTIVGQVGVRGNLDGLGSDALLGAPDALVIDHRQQFLYVADSFYCNIRRVDLLSGTYDTIVVAGTAPSASPSCGLLDGEGTSAQFGPLLLGLALRMDDALLFVSDTSNHVIRSVDLLTLAVTTFSGDRAASESASISVEGALAAATFHRPAGLLMSPLGEQMYVAEMGGTDTTPAAGGIRSIDLALGTVSSIDACGTTIGTADAPTCRWLEPRQLEWIPSTPNALYVSDSLSIRRLDLSTGFVSTAAGSSMASGTGSASFGLAGFSDSTAGGAFFSGLGGMAFDHASSASDAALIVAERGSSALRRVSVATGATSPYILSGGAAAGSGDCDYHPGHSDGVGRAAAMQAPTGLVSFNMGSPSGPVLVLVAPTSLSRIDPRTGSKTTMWSVPCVPALLVRGRLVDPELGYRSGAKHPNAPTLFLLCAQAVWRFDLTGPTYTAPVLLAGSASLAPSVLPSQFWNPAALVVDRVGVEIYVADSGNCRVSVVTIATGAVAPVVGGGAPGDGGNVCGDALLDTNAEETGTDALMQQPRALVIDPSNTFMFVMAAPPLPASVASPPLNGATLDAPARGTYAAGAQKLYRVQLTTRITTLVAGVSTPSATSIASGTVDGTGVRATFAQPLSLAVDVTGAVLYVGEYLLGSGVAAVRQVHAPTGLVTTIAGGVVAGCMDGVGVGAQMRRPTAMAIDDTRTIAYVASAPESKLRLLFLTPAPFVSDFSPSVLGASAPFPSVRLQGFHFGYDPTQVAWVRFYDAATRALACECLVQTWVSSEALSCVPELSCPFVAGATFRVRVGLQNGYVSLYSHRTLRVRNAPVITAVSPGLGAAGVDAVLLFGVSGLGNDAQDVDGLVAENGAACSGLVQTSPTTLRCTLPAAAVPAHPLALRFRVTVGGQQSALSVVTYSTAPPAIVTSYSQAHVPAYTATRLTIFGSGFGAAAGDVTRVTLLSLDGKGRAYPCLFSPLLDWLGPTSVACTVPPTVPPNSTLHAEVRVGNQADLTVPAVPLGVGNNFLFRQVVSTATTAKLHRRALTLSLLHPLEAAFGTLTVRAEIDSTSVEGCWGLLEASEFVFAPGGALSMPVYFDTPATACVLGFKYNFTFSDGLRGPTQFPPWLLQSEHRFSIEVVPTVPDWSVSLEPWYWFEFERPLYEQQQVRLLMANTKLPWVNVSVRGWCNYGSFVPEELGWNDTASAQTLVMTYVAPSNLSSLPDTAPRTALGGWIFDTCSFATGGEDAIEFNQPDTVQWELQPQAKFGFESSQPHAGSRWYNGSVYRFTLTALEQPSWRVVLPLSLTKAWSDAPLDPYGTAGGGAQVEFQDMLPHTFLVGAALPADADPAAENTLRVRYSVIDDEFFARWRAPPEFATPIWPQSAFNLTLLTSSYGSVDTNVDGGFSDASNVSSAVYLSEAYTVAVVPASAPDALVTLECSVDSGLILSPALELLDPQTQTVRLHFRADNWSLPQEILIQAPLDMPESAGAGEAAQSLRCAVVRGAAIDTLGLRGSVANWDHYDEFQFLDPPLVSVPLRHKSLALTVPSERAHVPDGFGGAFLRCYTGQSLAVTLALGLLPSTNLLVALSLGQGALWLPGGSDTTTAVFSSSDPSPPPAQASFEMLCPATVPPGGGGAGGADPGWVHLSYGLSEPSAGEFTPPPPAGVPALRVLVAPRADFALVGFDSAPTAPAPSSALAFLNMPSHFDLAPLGGAPEPWVIVWCELDPSSGATFLDTGAATTERNFTAQGGGAALRFDLLTPPSMPPGAGAPAITATCALAGVDADHFKAPPPVTIALRYKTVLLECSGGSSGAGGELRLFAGNSLVCVIRASADPSPTSTPIRANLTLSEPGVGGVAEQDQAAALSSGGASFTYTAPLTVQAGGQWLNLSALLWQDAPLPGEAHSILEFDPSNLAPWVSLFLEPRFMVTVSPAPPGSGVGGALWQSDPAEWYPGEPIAFLAGVPPSAPAAIEFALTGSGGATASPPLLNFTAQAQAGSQTIEFVLTAPPPAAFDTGSTSFGLAFSALSGPDAHAYTLPPDQGFVLTSPWELEFTAPPAAMHLGGMDQTWMVRVPVLPRATLRLAVRAEWWGGTAASPVFHSLLLQEVAFNASADASGAWQVLQVAAPMEMPVDAGMNVTFALGSLFPWQWREAPPARVGLLYHTLDFLPLPPDAPRMYVGSGTGTDVFLGAPVPLIRGEVFQTLFADLSVEWGALSASTLPLQGDSAFPTTVTYTAPGYVPPDTWLEGAPTWTSINATLSGTNSAQFDPLQQPLSLVVALYPQSNISLAPAGGAGAVLPFARWFVGETVALGPWRPDQPPLAETHHAAEVSLWLSTSGGAVLDPSDGRASWTDLNHTAPFLPVLVAPDTPGSVRLEFGVDGPDAAHFRAPGAALLQVHARELLELSGPLPANLSLAEASLAPGQEGMVSVALHLRPLVAPEPDRVLLVSLVHDGAPEWAWLLPSGPVHVNSVSSFAWTLYLNASLAPEDLRSINVSFVLAGNGSAQFLPLQPVRVEIIPLPPVQEEPSSSSSSSSTGAEESSSSSSSGGESSSSSSSSTGEGWSSSTGAVEDSESSSSSSSGAEELSSSSSSSSTSGGDLSSSSSAGTGADNATSSSTGAEHHSSSTGEEKASSSSSSSTGASFSSSSSTASISSSSSSSSTGPSSSSSSSSSSSTGAVLPSSSSSSSTGPAPSSFLPSITLTRPSYSIASGSGLSIPREEVQVYSEFVSSPEGLFCSWAVEDLAESNWTGTPRWPDLALVRLPEPPAPPTTSGPGHTCAGAALHVPPGVFLQEGLYTLRLRAYDLEHDALAWADVSLRVGPPASPPSQSSTGSASGLDSSSTGGGSVPSDPASSSSSSSSSTGGLIPPPPILPSAMPPLDPSLTPPPYTAPGLAPPMEVQAPLSADTCASSSPCLNGAGCLALPDPAQAAGLDPRSTAVVRKTLRCLCLPGWFGPQCQLAVLGCVSCTSGLEGNSSASFIGVGLGAVRGLQVGGVDAPFALSLALDPRSDAVQRLMQAPWPTAVRANAVFHMITLRTPSRAAIDALAAMSAVASSTGAAGAGASSQPQSQAQSQARSHSSLVFAADSSTLSRYEPLRISALFPAQSVPSVYALSDLIYYSSSRCTQPGEWKPARGGGCAACPASCASCPGGGRCWAAEGWWAFSELDEPIRCRVPSACPGTVVATVASRRDLAAANSGGGGGAGGAGTVDSALHNTQQCAAGYEGNACSDCSSGFYSLNGRCTACSRDGQWDLALRGLVAAALVAVLAVGVALFPPRALVLLVTAVLALQQLSVVGMQGMSALNAQSSSLTFERLTAFFQYLSWLNFSLDIFKPGCGAVPHFSPVAMYWSTVLLLALAGTTFLVACAARLAWRSRCGRQWRVQRRVGLSSSVPAVAAAPASEPAQPATCSAASIRSEATKDFRERALHAALLLGVLFYFRMALLQFGLFRCVSAPRPQSFDAGAPSQIALLLRDDFTTVCFEGTHLLSAAVAIVGLLVYTAGFPFLVLTVLCRTVAPILVGLQRTQAESLKAAEAAAAGAKDKGREKSRSKGRGDAPPAPLGVGGLTGLLIARFAWFRPRPSVALVVAGAALVPKDKYRPGTGAAPAGSGSSSSGSAESSVAELSESGQRKRNNGFMQQQDQTSDATAKTSASPAADAAGPGASSSPDAALSVTEASVLYSGAMASCGLLFRNLKLEHFSFRVAALVFVALQAAFATLVDSADAQLFLLGLCFVSQSATTTWLQPFQLRRHNKQACALHLAAGAHACIMLAVQPQRSVLLFVLLALWALALALLLWRGRLQRWLSKRAPALVPRRVSKDALTAAVVLAANQKADADTEAEADLSGDGALRSQKGVSIPRRAAPRRTATVSITSTVQMASPNHVRFGRDSHAPAPSALRASSLSSERDADGGSSPAESLAHQRQPSSSGSFKKHDRGDRSSLSLSLAHPAGVAASAAQPGVVLEQKKQRMTPILRASRSPVFGSVVASPSGVAPLIGIAAAPAVDAPSTPLRSPSSRSNGLHARFHPSLDLHQQAEPDAAATSGTTSADSTCRVTLGEFGASAMHEVSPAHSSSPSSSSGSRSRSAASQPSPDEGGRTLLPGGVEHVDDAIMALPQREATSSQHTLPRALSDESQADSAHAPAPGISSQLASLLNPPTGAVGPRRLDALPSLLTQSLAAPMLRPYAPLTPLRMRPMPLVAGTPLTQPVAPTAAAAAAAAPVIFHPDPTHADAAPAADRASSVLEPQLPGDADADSE